MIKQKHISLAILSIAVLFGFSCSNTIAEDTWIASVNNEKISKKMFLQFISKNRANVYSLFGSKYKIEYYKDFWKTKFDNKTPEEVLKKKSLDDCIEVTIQKILAKEKGVLKEISYNSFLKELNEVNESRQNSVGNKKIVYGPVVYSEESYFNHQLGLTIIELKNRLIGKEISISEEILKKFYEENKSSLYVKSKKNDEVKFFAFDGIKQVVQTNYIDKEYEKIIDVLIEKADVKINEKALSQITIE